MARMLFAALPGLLLTGGLYAQVDCANPLALPSGATSLAVDTTGAPITDVYNACHSSTDDGFPRAEYYSWIPDRSGVWTLSFCTSNGAGAWHSKIGLYTDACATEIACSQEGESCLFGSSVTANLTAGNSYIIQLGGWHLETGSGTFSTSYDGDPLANDECVNATALAAGALSTPFDSTNATHDSAPGCSSSFSPAANIWYSWSPLTDGAYTISTSNSTMGMRLSVYSACSGTSLGCWSDPSDEASLTLGGLMAANTYTIMVSGSGDQTGTGTLNIAPFANSVNDTCETATVLAPGVQQVPIDTTSATASGVSSSCQQGSLDNWYEWTADTTATWRFSTCVAGASFDTWLTLYSACGGAELACNANAGGLCGNLSQMDVSLSSGTTYWIQVGGWGWFTGTGTLDIGFPPGPPTNDDCATALDVGTLMTIPYDNTGAVTSGDAGQCFQFLYNTAFHQDVWFEWTAATSGLHRMTNTSGINAVLAVYDGSDCATSQRVQCDYLYPYETWSPVEVELWAVAGSSYLIVVGGYDDGVVGAGQIDIVSYPPPVNETCASATLLAPGSHQGLEVATIGATPSGVIPACGASGGFLPVDVWYEWSPHVTGDWRFTTCSGFSNFNSRLALYDACLGNHLGCGSGPLQYACYDPWDSELTVALTAGNSYYLQVSGEAGAVGTLRMDIENVGPGYCPLTPNSAGPGAVMSASGIYIPSNNLTLVCTGAPPMQPALFFYGPAQLQLPFGEGNRCVGGEVVRLWPPGVTDVTGMITRAVDNTLPSHVGVIVNGARLNFQCWFRDPAGGASGFNLSNAYSLDFFGG